jgi:hypothetical protein
MAIWVRLLFTLHQALEPKQAQFRTVEFHQNKGVMSDRIALNCRKRLQLQKFSIPIAKQLFNRGSFSTAIHFPFGGTESGGTETGNGVRRRKTRGDMSGWRLLEATDTTDADLLAIELEMEHQLELIRLRRLKAKVEYEDIRTDIPE